MSSHAPIVNSRLRSSQPSCRRYQLGGPVGTSRFPGKSLLWVWFLALVGSMIGCDFTPPRFHLDMIYVRKNEDPEAPFSKSQLANLAEVLTAVFGTPDEPHVIAVANLGMHDLVEERNLKLAAGPVGSDMKGRSRGLYRQHCAHCHGITGDGAGPTAAYLNPYPRDYRMGIFKFKSDAERRKADGRRPGADSAQRHSWHGHAVLCSAGGR